MKPRNQRNGNKPRHAQNHSAIPEVVYTQPDPVNRKKLVLRLTTVCVVVLALFVGFSIFFRVDTVEVSGTNMYNESTILEVSGIEMGDSLLTFGKAKACAQIIEKLPYVENVRIGIKLPGTVRIYIEEVDVIYSVQDTSDNWWFMTAEGRLVEPTNRSEAAKHTMVKGIQLVSPKKGQQAVAAEPEPDETYVAGDEEHTIVTVTNGERLQTLLEILLDLEQNEILGEVDEVDVSDLGDLRLKYDSKTTVLLGDPSRMDEKIQLLKAIVSDKDVDHTGTVDLTDPGKDKPVTITPT
ncbi:MAG: FtsQ-type POTRA domain-containing protein [Ruminococcaceae bacterium]|nr:FtsQ-type POTRA domain-containing protein [Oscillospiraceae bacterium]